MPEVYCERQLNEDLRLKGEGRSRCEECIPDFLAESQIPNNQCLGYMYYVSVKAARVFEVVE